MTAQLATRTLPAGRAAVDAAVKCLAQGGLVAFPTETVYGLGADATDGMAVARLYAAKGRPAFNPLISHVTNVEAARALGLFDASADRLAKALWPGPLTLVLPKAPASPVSDLATAGLDTIALRVPAHTIARDILTAFGRPVVAPSANRSGHVSPTDAQHVLADLGGRIDLIIDGGPTPVGVESTIVACLSGRAFMLRPGGIARRDIEAVLGRPLADPAGDPQLSRAHAPPSPGRLAAHYSPRTRLRLNVDEVKANEALLAFGMPLAPGAAQAIARAQLVGWRRPRRSRCKSLLAPAQSRSGRGSRNRRYACPRRGAR